MKKNTRSRARIVVGALIFAIVAYGWIITRAKFEWGGESPDAQVLGVVSEISQRAMNQVCTGVIVTPQSTWLVGRQEGIVSSFAFAHEVQNLSEIIVGSRSDEPILDSVGNYGKSSHLRSDPEVSFISRLDESGKFQLVAVVPESVCLHATPDGKRVFLLTGLKRPEHDQKTATGQYVIFFSDDQGRTWQWRKEGLFPNSESPYLYFYDANSVWSRGKLESANEETSVIPTVVSSGLLYSPDGGTTIESVMASEPLLVSLNEIRQSLGAEIQWDDKNGDLGETTQHVTQFGAKEAALWNSQSFRYAKDGLNFSHSVRITSYAPLRRENGTWQMGKAQRWDGFVIKSLVDNRAGRTVALVEEADGLKVALLNRSTLKWEVQGALPTAFGILPSDSGLRAWHVSREAIVVNIWSSHKVPRWLYPWGRNAANISADSVFYSTDWGRSWTQLSIDGYLGVLGMDGERNRVVWAKGNWHSSNDLYIHSYGLH